MVILFCCKWYNPTGHITLVYDATFEVAIGLQKLYKLNMSRVERGFILRFGGYGLDILQLLYGISPELSEFDHDLILEIGESLQKGGPLKEVGRGGDMVALSRPDLSFVIKFPYDDSYLIPRPRFSRRIREGFLLAKKYLGGIFAPSIDFPLVIQSSDKEVAVSIIVQQRVSTVSKIIQRLRSEQSNAEETAKILDFTRQNYIEITREMWERGILDCDPSWEENYGFMDDGRMVLIDVGDLSDKAKHFSHFEGIPRRNLYERALQPTFTRANFKQFFKKNLAARSIAPAVDISPRKNY